MSNRITNRWMLVLLVGAGQLLILLFGGVWLTRWLDHTITREVHNRSTLAAADFAMQFAATVNELQIDSLEPDTESWHRMQHFVERYTLPNEGYVCIIRSSDGAMLNHPDWRSVEAVRTASLADAVLQMDTKPKPLLQAGNRQRPDQGWLDSPDGSERVAVLNLPNLDAKLLIHQPEEVIQGNIDAYIATVRRITLAITAVVVLLSLLLTAGIVRQYESRLQSINDNLSDLVAKRSKALLKSRSAVIFGMAKLAESRDGETGAHLERIRRYVRILGDELAKTHPEIDAEFVDTIEETSALHDIGKVGVPDSVLCTPEVLTAEQRTIIEKHPLIGGDAFLAVKQKWGDDPFLVTACEIIFAHHERWDGTGYPFGLEGEIIPISARIVALADVYDALTSQRRYKESMTHEAAREIILESRGKQFDPDVVDAFEKWEDEFKRVSEELQAA